MNRLIHSNEKNIPQSEKKGSKFNMAHHYRYGQD